MIAASVYVSHFFFLSFGIEGAKAKCHPLPRQIKRRQMPHMTPPWSYFGLRCTRTTSRFAQNAGAMCCEWGSGSTYDESGDSVEQCFNGEYGDSVEQCFSGEYGDSVEQCSSDEYGDSVSSVSVMSMATV